MIAGHVYRRCASGGVGASCPPQGPVAGDTILVKSGATVVARAQTGDDGGYRIEVPAALYGLEETRTGQATRVQVEAGRTVVADFTIT